MKLMFTSFVFMIVAVYFVFFTFFPKLGRFSAFKTFVSKSLPSLLNSKVAKFMLVVLFVGLAYSNVLGNIPGNYTPTQYYSVVMRIRLTF